MVNVYCDTIDQALISAAKILSRKQKDVVKLIAPTATLEVRYEEEAEETQEETFERQEKETEP